MQSSAICEESNDISERRDAMLRWTSSLTLIKVNEEVHLSMASLLSLMSLLSSHIAEDCIHDNLLPTAVDGCKGGHRGSAKTTGSDDSGRRRSRADGCDGARRSGRSDRPHSS